MTSELLLAIDPARLAARLGLGPAKNEWDEPWRHFLLLYLAHLCEIADYEGRAFGPTDARLALERLADDVKDVLTLLRRRRG